eukprot:g690.t1
MSSSHEVPSKEWQDFLVRIAEDVAATHKAELLRLPPATTLIMDTQEKYGEFVRSFLTAFRKKVAEETAASRDAGLRKIPEEVVAQIAEFGGSDADTLPRILPPRVFQLPAEIVRQVWIAEISARRKSWKEEGENLLSRLIEEAAVLSAQSITVSAASAQQWLASYPRYPDWPRRSVMTGPTGVSQLEIESSPDYSGLLENLCGAFKAGGYKVDKRLKGGFPGARWVFTVSYCAAYPDPVPTPGARYDLIWGADDSPQLRVTVLTDRLLRVQYAAHGAHAVHDLPTTAVINRRFPLVADVQASSSDKIFRLETKKIKFEYDTSKPNWPDGFRLLELKEKDGGTAIISSASGGREGVGRVSRRAAGPGPQPRSPLLTLTTTPKAPRQQPATAATPTYGTWEPAEPYAGNLLGTIRTLDSFENPDLDCAKMNDTKDENHCRYGVLSTTGIALLDDTGMPVYADFGMQPSANPCATPDHLGATPSCADLYLFAYGRDFAGALSAFRTLSGAAPMPPRYAFGVWFTRWYDFDDENVRDMVAKFENSNVPLDVWIFDMNWHKFGDWGGFSWNENILPQPDKLVQGHLKGEKGLHVGLNFHDADGVKKTEEKYAALKELLNLPKDFAEDIPFVPANASYLQAVEEAVVAPLGIDIPWIDYQQGEKSFNVSGQIPNLNPTVMLNSVRTLVRTGAARAPHVEQRSAILSRFPGVGGHRYPVGFAGDQAHTWAGLKYLPYFTSTASNVAFGFWSHDIYGGTRVNKVSQDPELNTRWIQYGVLSPIFRMHEKGESTGPCADDDSCSRVLIWDHPRENFDAEVEVLRFRGRLVPYLYTAAYELTHRRGLAIVQPLYYGCPAEKLAYDYSGGPDRGGGYYFGGTKLVAYPVVEKADEKTMMTNMKMWLPAPATAAAGAEQSSESIWYDRSNGKFESGNREIERRFLLEEYGLFQDATLVIPLHDRKEPIGGAAAAVMEDITWQAVVPPMTAKDTTEKTFVASGSFFEDDGVSFDFEKKHSNVTITISWSADRKKAKVEIVEVSSSRNTDPRSHSTPPRRHRIELLNFAGKVEESTSTQQIQQGAAAGVAEIKRQRRTGAAASSSTAIDLGANKSKSATSVELTLDGVILDGFRGAVAKARKAKKLLDDANIRYGVADRGRLSDACATGVQIGYALEEGRGGGNSSRSVEEAVSKLVADFWKALGEGRAQVAALRDFTAEPRRSRTLAMLDEAISLGGTRGRAFALDMSVGAEEKRPRQPALPYAAADGAADAEVLVEYCDASNRSVGRLAQTCTALRNTILEDDGIWRTLFQRRFGAHATVTAPPNPHNSTELMIPARTSRIASSTSTSGTADALRGCGTAPSGACSINTFRDHYVALHDLERRFRKGLWDRKLKLATHPTPVCDVHLNPGTRDVCIALGSGEIVCMRGRDVLSRKHAVSPAVRCFVAPGEVLYAGLQNGDILIGDDFSLQKAHAGKVCGLEKCVGAGEESLLFSCSPADDCVKLWDLNASNARDPVMVWRHDSASTLSVVSGVDVWTGGSDRMLNRWDAREMGSGRPVQSFGPADDWVMMVEAGSGNMVRAADKAIHLWDPRYPKSAVLSTHRHQKLITRFHSMMTRKTCAPRLVSCSLDGRVKISSLDSYNFMEASLVHSEATTLPCSNDYVLCVDFDDTKLLVGGVDGTLFEYDFERSFVRGPKSNGAKRDGAHGEQAESSAKSSTKKQKKHPSLEMLSSEDDGSSTDEQEELMRCSREPSSEFLYGLARQQHLKELGNRLMSVESHGL